MITPLPPAPLVTDDPATFNTKAFARVAAEDLLVTQINAQIALNDITAAAEVHALSSKTTPVDSDEVPLLDSAASFVLKKLTWANIKATLATWLGDGTITKLAVHGAGLNDAIYGQHTDHSGLSGFSNEAYGATLGSQFGSPLNLDPQSTAPTTNVADGNIYYNSTTDKFMGRANGGWEPFNLRTPRVLSAASYTTDTGTSLNCDDLDEFIVTAQAGALLFNNPTGTPTNGQVLLIAVTGTAARALTWDTQFAASTVALPTTTVTTARLTMAFIWDAATSTWIIMGAV